MEKENILEIKELRTHFSVGKDRLVKAVDGVSFVVKKGETLGIVGESGSGKSITALSVLRLVDEPGEIVGGEILFKGESLLDKKISQMRKIRGNQISMIFQEPMTSLNPVHSIGKQIRETLEIHEDLTKKESNRRALELLKMVGIPSPEKRLTQYPFELSGGMRQRVMIAIALACNPDLLIADEPTTALDVTIQAQILELIKESQAQLNMSVMLITHDLGVVAETCDQVAVMYAGQVVEYSDVETLFEEPKHPYTAGLLKSLPRHDIKLDELTPIRGMVPSPFNMPAGCRFAPRCPFATELCVQKAPDLINLAEGQEIRCWIYSDEWDGKGGVEIYEANSIT